MRIIPTECFTIVWTLSTTTFGSCHLEPEVVEWFVSKIEKWQVSVPVDRRGKKPTEVQLAEMSWVGPAVLSAASWTRAEPSHAIGSGNTPKLPAQSSPWVRNRNPPVAPSDWSTRRDGITPSPADASQSEGATGRLLIPRRLRSSASSWRSQWSSGKTQKRNRTHNLKTTFSFIILRSVATSLGGAGTGRSLQRLQAVTG